MRCTWISTAIRGNGSRRGGHASYRAGCRSVPRGRAKFLIPESTAAQRITRAKRKISDAGIPYRIPDPDELGGRLSEVLAVVYLLFNEAYLSSSGENATSAHLAEDAEFLAALLSG